MGLNMERTQGKSEGRGVDDNIIKSTTEEAGSQRNEPQKESSNAGGRPSTIENPRRTTLTIEERHISNIRQIRAQIMSEGGEEISRSAAVRSIFDALGEADLDYSRVRSKEDLRQLIVEKLS
jgi:hypothetical protein